MAEELRQTAAVETEVHGPAAPEHTGHATEAVQATVDKSKLSVEDEMRYTLWYRFGHDDDPDLDDGQISFLTTCFSENLNHARHVENERLTFNTMFMALAGCVLAFVHSIDNYVVAMVMNLILIMLGFIAMLLTRKWDHVFDRHQDFAKGDYLLLHKSLFPLKGDDTDHSLPINERLNNLNELPAYCFRPKNSTSPNPVLNWLWSIRTRQLFSCFYWLMEVILILSECYFLYQWIVTR